MNSYDKLLELNLIESKTVTINGVMDEVISTDNIFKYATDDLQRDIKQEKKSNIFEELETKRLILRKMR